VFLIQDFLDIVWIINKLLLHPFNGPFSRTVLDFSEARDDEVAVASALPYASHLLFALPAPHC